MRPHTPSLDTAHVAAGPTSPPETPTTGSPKINRKAAAINGHLPRHSKSHGHQRHPSNIRPLGGTKFSYTRAPRPEEISPRSSNSSSEESVSSASPPQSPLSDIPKLRHQHVEKIAASIRIEQAAFSIEELSDDCSLNSEDDHLHVLRPYAFEYANSERSRSRSRPPPDMDPAVMTGIENLNTFEDSDADIDRDDEEFVRQLQKRREERRLRRMKSGSLSKRTVSERGSDSDREDVLPYYEGNETGPTRRMRRKVGDRISIQFTGALPERIEELKEPNSDDEIILDDAEIFARELPYWTLMDVDSE
ncbi:uncharacterized protein GGS22DRAFT_119468 [Annulohypoxylon maeteangense]|uniref:uncharacterized protein n=1 Tax=Annulohypoxylon maeteangense TaxID=1927788 RepID=UPI002007E792|nr:uncharacterized protein GGS22DRAFT_119468 [Annulohypoxylon maeteangense]KAI0886948.1 hypothetical protein GGS22DRAFT_119468 [Annulohypoxylon maeteangense]